MFRICEQLKAENEQLRAQLNAEKENRPPPLNADMEIIKDHIADVVRTEMENCLRENRGDDAADVEIIQRRPCYVPRNWPFQKPDEHDLV